MKVESTNTNNESTGGAPLPVSPPSPINIWLVDDNKGIRSLMMELLDGYDGFECKTAFPSPNAVLSTLASKPGPDVILLDIQMGEACGLDAIRPIKALSRSTQILMFTSCSDPSSKKRALSSGASGFLLKHYPLEQIRTSIREASRNPAPHLKCSRFPASKSAASQKSRLSKHPAGGWLGRILRLKVYLNLMNPGRN